MTKQANPEMERDARETAVRYYFTGVSGIARSWIDDPEAGEYVSEFKDDLCFDDVVGLAKLLCTFAKKHR